MTLTGQGSPDWEVVLTSPDPASTAAAVALGWNEESGTRVHLDISGLDEAPDGFVYELWFSAGDVYVSAGTFRGTDGVQLRSGVRRGAYPRLWVTLEPLDGDPAPTAVSVLDTG